jgi:hypothetical protein
MVKVLNERLKKSNMDNNFETEVVISLYIKINFVIINLIPLSSYNALYTLFIHTLSD